MWLVNVVGQGEVKETHDCRLPIQFCVPFPTRTDFKNTLQLADNPRTVVYMKTLASRMCRSEGEIY